AAVPGVWISDKKNLVVPPNAFYVVRGQLLDAGVRFHVIDNRPPVPEIDWRNDDAMRRIIPAEARPKVPTLGHPIEYLKPWQRQVLAESAYRAGEFMRVDAGGGKTFVFLLWALMQPGLAVVICKAGARTQVYEETVRLTTVKPLILEGEKATAIPGDTRMVILGWETLHAWLAPLLAAKPVSVVYDEIHKLKQHKRAEARLNPRELDADGNPSLTFERLGNISDCASQLSRAAKRRMGSTATPVPDRLHDLWSQLDCLEPGQWGDSLSFDVRYAKAYKDEWGRWQRKGSVEKGTPLHQELMSRLATMMHDLPRSLTHGDLPEKRRQVTVVSAHAQTKAAGGFRDELRRAVLAGDKHRLLELKLQEAATRKRRFVLDRVDEALRNGQKIIIFTGRARDCEELAEDCKKLAAKIGVVKFKGIDGVEYAREAEVFFHHGDVEKAEKRRDEIRHRWVGYAGDPERGIPAVEVHPGPAVLVATAQSLGESYNLHDTDLLILAQLPITPKDVEQWEGRVSRQGGRRKVLIVYPIAEGTHDERMAEILLDKLPAVEAVTTAEGVKGLAAELGGDNNREELLDSLFNELVGGVTERADAVDTDTAAKVATESDLAKRVLAFVKDQGEGGATDAEIASELSIDIESARLMRREWVQLGRIVDTKRKRERKAVYAVVEVDANRGVARDDAQEVSS
ncbi:MAG TPA: hypothetical protein VEA38_25455, partial [Terriglobales bacterium]|nr:hypothetical protein [Terriglobales bacterium]